MTIREIKKILGCQVLTGTDKLDLDIKHGCGCDLMSDVLAYAKPGALLLSGLNNLQVIRTAEMSEIKAVCLVRGKQPGDGVVELARENGLILLTTKLPLFEACGKLYQHGLCGCSETAD